MPCSLRTFATHNCQGNKKMKGEKEKNLRKGKASPWEGKAIEKNI
jgi:hypothetical protein